MRHARDTCGLIDLDADEATGFRDHVVLAGVDAHPDPDLDPVGPRLVAQGALRRDRGGETVGRLLEGDEERVALGALLAGVVAELGPRGPYDRAVSLADRRVALPAELLLESGLSLDIREEEGPGPAPGHRFAHPSDDLSAVSLR